MGETLQHTCEGDPYEIVRFLTEVDHLNRFRMPDGEHSQYALDQLLVNLTPAVQEAAQPYAVTPTYRDRVGDDYIWMGQTMRETAESGKVWYKSPQAFTRMDVEIDEAVDVRDNLRPGWLKIFISPRMTEEDAPREVAEQEHLTDFDAVRTSQLDVEGGEIQGMRLDSLLIRDIPLSAWIAMANDPSGLFEGRIQIPEANSALPIMRAHREMHVPADKLPEGPLSVVSAVVPYIADAAVKEKVEWHLAMFRSINQQEAHDNAETIALRWRAFEVDLADSLHTGFATPGILQFIKSVDGQFNSDTRALIAERFQADGRLVIDRPLAAKLEAARRNTLWVAAAVVAENEDVLAQLPPEVADRIRANEQLLQLAQANGYSVQQILELEADNNRTIAQYNVAVGRGCPGVTEDVFEREQEQKAERREEADTLGGKIRCIKCRQFVPKREVVKKTCWECPKCNHKVDICSGKVLREGDAPDPEMVARILQPLAVDGLARRVNQTRPAVREMAEEEMEPALA